jgi:hypothetical protein
MDQPLSAATKSTLLVWILWSVDVNDGQQSWGVSALRDKEVILHECGPDDAIAVQRSSPNCRYTE